MALEEQLTGRPERRVTEGLVRDPGRPPGEVSERRERFAALIRAEQTAILESYVRSLEASVSPVIARPQARAQAMTDAAEILTDVAASLGGGEPAREGRCDTLSRMTGPSRAEHQLSPADLLRAAQVLFNITVSSLSRHVTEDPGLLPCFSAAVVALNESIGRRIGEATLAYHGYLLERLDQAHAEERHRIARDLHDRLGEGMSVALRQLELWEIASRQDPVAASPRAARAKDAITEAMRRLRLVTSDLRQEPVRSLEKALIQYLDSVVPDAAAAAEVRLRVSGDETWVPPTVIDEAFLILREAIRNALRHGSPSTLLIGVALAPHELHAWVEDDGCGFIRTEAGRTGTGLASMQERAALVGGRLAVASSPGRGTHVELVVPLPGQVDG